MCTQIWKGYYRKERKACLLLQKEAFWLQYEVSAMGFVIPPYFVYPKVRVTNEMKKGALLCSVAVVHSSGWMTKENVEKIVYWDHLKKIY